MRLTRRHLFAGAAAAASAAVLKPAPAQAALARNTTGVYRYKLGDFEIIQLMDGARTFPIPDDFVVNVSKDRAIKAAAEAYMPDGKVTIPFSPMVVNTGSKLIAIDTGNGLGAFRATKGLVGQARGNMLAAGIDPNKIDMVIISHFHGDHIGGLKNPDGSLAFPHAEIKVPALEWAFWTDESNASKANSFNSAWFPGAKQMLAGLADKVSKYEDGQELAPGITALATPGHTPGHMSFVVASGSKHILVQTDVSNIPWMFLRHPGWHSVYDNEPELAEKTRRRVYDMAAAEKTVVVGYHFPYPCVGHVEKNGKDYRLVPVAWDPNNH
jgi:glyoxylase-like metal-dependent hydrolase (beta-lactamase superfamily II)